MSKKVFIGVSVALISSLLFIGCNKSVDNSKILPENNEVQVVDAKDSLENNGVQVVITDFGAKGASVDDNLNQEKMLKYAMEDEFLARGEYETIIEKYGQVKPFVNIIKAEEKHIGMLNDLYAKYTYKVPDDNSKDYIVIPENLNDSFKAGVAAEIDNIEMYDNFLKQNIPDDIKQVFVELRDASKSHLSSFQKNVK